MAYTKPSTLVYQELVDSTSSSSLDPDMPACIVGPLTTVIEVDLTSSTSKIDSIGSTSDITQSDATFTATPDTDSVIYVNFSSAKAGQVLDTDSIELTAEDPQVKTYEYTATAAVAAGDSIVLESNEIGDTTATSSTALSFYTTKNHVNLGDAVNITTGTTTVSTYVSGVDYDTNTITINSSTATISIGDVVSIYHKFDSLTVGAYETIGSDGGIPYDDIYPLEASADISGYTMFSEYEIEGSGDSLSIYVAYSADRADLSGRIITITDTTDLVDQFGTVNSSNPLAYAVSVALANSGGTSILAIALDPSLSESLGHTSATELAQSQRIYNLVPLTQELSIHATYKTHVNAMSTAAPGNWRTVLTNCAIPEEDYLLGQPDSADGTDDDDYPDLLQSGTYDSSNYSITLPRGESAPLVYAGDYVKLYILDDETYLTSSLIQENSGDTIVLTNNEWTDENGDSGTAPTTGSTIYFYIARESTTTGQAEWVASQAETWSDSRVWMFPGNVTIPDDDGLDEVLPGYYLMAGLAGFISGTTAQQPITNITLASVSDLEHGNFYFTDDQLNTMAEAGVLLYAQNSQGTTPYCRHGLTTDVSVLAYREVLKVKNWDYLSYYYKDIIDPFIGTWNITTDTIQTIRQTVTAASESLLTRKVAKIGAPLLSYSIDTLEQNADSSDSIDLVMSVSMVDPNNYTNVTLQL